MKTPEKVGALVQCLYDGKHFLNKRNTCMRPSQSKTLRISSPRTYHFA